MNFYNFKLIIISYNILLFSTACSDFFLSEVDECGVPAGDNSSCLDECGIPNGNGISEEECDCDGNVIGCYGECGSNLVYDICGVCDGGESNEDNCACEDPSEEKDCLGECGGSVVVDDCNICNGDNSFCTGCMISGADNYSPNNTISDNENCTIDYLTVELIFDTYCTSCHGSSGDGGVDLSSYSNVISSNIIVAGDSLSSRLWEVIGGPNPTMPDGQIGTLSNTDIHKIALWIEFGANN